jgi:hypothetical protein
MQPSTPEYFFGMVLLHFSQGSQRAVNLILGVLPHATRVVENRVRFPQVISQLVTLFLQTGHDHFAIQNVHLAADRFNV